MQQNYDDQRRGLTLDEVEGGTDKALPASHHEPHVTETEIEAEGWVVADVLHEGQRAGILHGGAGEREDGGRAGAETGCRGGRRGTKRASGVDGV
jgi:hypothetical protein